MSQKDKNSASLLGKTTFNDFNCFNTKSPTKGSPFFENLAHTQGNDCWLTSVEAAAFLRVTANALRIMVYKRKVRYYKLGRRLRFRKTDLLSTPTLQL